MLTALEGLGTPRRRSPRRHRWQPNQSFDLPEPEQRLGAVEWCTPGARPTAAPTGPERVRHGCG